MERTTGTVQAGVVHPGAADGLDFDDCFRHHYARLVRSLGAGADGAEEAVQEAFVEAHLRWRTVSRLDDPVGWVRRVAIRRILNQNRSLLRRTRAVGRLADGARRAEGPPSLPDDGLAAAIRRLPVRQRIALVLHHLDGLPVREVADAMGVAEGTVKSQLHDARANLRTMLEVDDD
ncbi:RNA polymerase sigma factor [Actinomarinicola tropica]|uniref:RNA polymerase sigma factor n=1 Tax=Actinomarinicola tropica TaxID=2789776 RepID=UPI001E4CA08C|nr:sigma-70 family RNA polymerase sigma factor [Actinomarinicola tropica]